jgi:hypothetical protein
MTNATNQRGELNNPALCASCAAIQRNWRRAPGHAELVQTSSRKVERSSGDSGGRTVTVTSYRCDACGTRWEYENDKTNQQAGWSVVEK